MGARVVIVQTDCGCALYVDYLFSEYESTMQLRSRCLVSLYILNHKQIKLTGMFNCTVPGTPEDDILTLSKVHTCSAPSFMSLLYIVLEMGEPE